MKGARIKRTLSPSLAARLKVVEGTKWPLLIEMIPDRRAKNNPRDFKDDTEAFHHYTEYGSCGEPHSYSEGY